MLDLTFFVSTFQFQRNIVFRLQTMLTLSESLINGINPPKIPITMETGNKKSAVCTLCAVHTPGEPNLEDVGATRALNVGVAATGRQ